jgi:hypothetical protein
MTPIENNLTPSSCQQQAHPAHAALRELHGLHAAQQPFPVEPVIRLLKVQEDDAARLLHLLEVVNFLQMVQHIVCNVAARDKGCLGGVYDAGTCWPKPMHHYLGNDLEVAVEEGDGPVAGWVFPGLATPLVDEGDEA